MSNNSPFYTLNDGNIKATIWKNEGEKGPYYSVQFSRIYTDDSGNIKNSDSFTRTDILKVERLAGKAYDGILKQIERDKSEAGTLDAD